MNIKKMVVINDHRVEEVGVVGQLTMYSRLCNNSTMLRIFFVEKGKTHVMKELLVKAEMNQGEGYIHSVDLNTISKRGK
jgi:hypothetical protein